MKNDDKNDRTDRKKTKIRKGEITKKRDEKDNAMGILAVSL